MRDKSRLTNIALIILGAVFIVSLVLIVVINNKTQTDNFWDNQQDKLSLITEKCAVEINDWAILHETIVKGFTDEISSDRFQSIVDYEDYLTFVAKQSPDILLAYIMFDDGTLHLNGESTVIDLVGKEFEEWYWAGRYSNGEIVFSEPCIDEVTGGLVVSCVTSISMPDGRDGIAGIDIDLDDLNATINRLNPSENGGAWMASPRGRVMTYIDPELLPKIIDGKTVYTYSKDIFSQTTVLDVNEKYIGKNIEISRIIDYDSAEKYESITTISQTGWILAVNIPIHDYDNAVQKVIQDQYPIILLAILMSIISIIFAFVMITNSRRQHNLKKNIEIAQAASKTKSDFLSRMSHEIRTPLNAIIGMVNIAMGATNNEKTTDCLIKADNASKHLLGVINDILDMSKIEADKFELDHREFNFEKMLMTVTNVTNFRAEEKKQNFIVNLNGNVPTSIVGDDLRLAQVITNLLTNAVKFTPEYGTVILNIDKTEDSGGEVALKIEVKDNGIGISPEQQERLFTSFEQADGGIARKFGGTGLGLAISKRIVELMGGRIWIESELDKGSKFIFTMKAGKGNENTRVKLSEKINRNEMRILAVDDSPEIREYFRHVMESLGLPCDVAANGGEALHMIKSCGGKPYNIFFIDWQMPEMNGIELTKKIKEAAPDNSVVFMISVAEWGSIEKEALAVGVRSFISKPLFPSTLVNAINECMEIGPRKPEVDAGASTDKKQRNFSSHTILIAEDVEINREIMSAILEDTGVNIDYAENGSAAISMFKAAPGKYSLVLMDIHMPEIDGYEATRRIRALELSQSKGIPIIAMTANVFREDIEACLSAGMNDHLGKPVDSDALFDKLDKYLG